MYLTYIQQASIETDELLSKASNWRLVEDKKLLQIMEGIANVSIS